ncbi:addiction module antidote protein, partial [Rugamonas violacea]
NFARRTADAQTGRLRGRGPPAIRVYETFRLVTFINEFLADCDARMFAEAILVACKAKGMAEVAGKAGIARESLYKALRPESQPRFDTMLKVLNAIGLRLVVQPIGRA